MAKLADIVERISGKGKRRFIPRSPVRNSKGNTEGDEEMMKYILDYLVRCTDSTYAYHTLFKDHVLRFAESYEAWGLKGKDLKSAIDDASCLQEAAAKYVKNVLADIANSIPRLPKPDECLESFRADRAHIDIEDYPLYYILRRDNTQMDSFMDIYICGDVESPSNVAYNCIFHRGKVYVFSYVRLDDNSSRMVCLNVSNDMSYTPEMKKLWDAYTQESMEVNVNADGSRASRGEDSVTKSPAWGEMMLALDPFKGRVDGMSSKQIASAYMDAIPWNKTFINFVKVGSNRIDYQEYRYAEGVQNSLLYRTFSSTFMEAINERYRSWGESVATSQARERRIANSTDNFFLELPANQSVVIDSNTMLNLPETLGSAPEVMNNLSVTQLNIGQGRGQD